jgi:hypothetical protein
MKIDLNKTSYTEKEKRGLRPIIAQFESDMRRTNQQSAQSIQDMSECIDTLNGWMIVLKKLFGEDAPQPPMDDYQKLQAIGNEILADIEKEEKEKSS